MRASRPAALVLVALLGLAACGSDASNGTVSAPAASSAPASSSLLDLTVDTVSDGPLALSQFEGKPVAFWFWAPG